MASVSKNAVIQAEKIALARATMNTGIASFAGIALGMLATKINAVYLGTDGMGYWAALTGAIATAAGIATTGILPSGVRAIAEAKANDRMKVAGDTAWAMLLFGLIAPTVLTLCLGLWRAFSATGNWAQVILGVEPRSVWVIPVIILCLALSGIGCSVSSILQGYGKIKAAAWNPAIAAFFGLLGSVALVIPFHQKAILPMMVVAAITSVGIAVVMLNKSRVLAETHIPTDFTGILRIWKQLLPLGFTVGFSSLLVLISNYITLRLVLEKSGESGLAIFNTGFRLTMTYAGFIFTSMSMGYYPRLVALLDKREEFNRAVNFQTEICLLFGIPGVLILAGSAPWLVRVLYAQGFEAAAPVQQYVAIGVLARFLGWPLSTTLLAMEKKKLILLTESLFVLVNLGLVFAFLPSCGVDATGIAFAISYVLYFLMMAACVNRISGWHPTLLNLILGFGALAILAFVLWTSCRDVAILGLLAAGVAAIGVGLFAIPLARSCFGHRLPIARNTPIDAQ